MTPEAALEIFARSLMREILSTPSFSGGYGQGTMPPDEGPIVPTPRLDFVPEADPFAEAMAQAREALEQEPPEMDTGSGLRARAQRIRERQYPEEMPMRGMAPPEES